MVEDRQPVLAVAVLASAAGATRAGGVTGGASRMPFAPIAPPNFGTPAGAPVVAQA